LNFKLDENLGKHVADILHQSGYNVATVVDQNLCGVTDETLIGVCNRENRCLITLDMEFGNPLLFKPTDYSGIIVLRLGPKPSLPDFIDAVNVLIKALGKNNISGKLWVVQRNRIREYQPEDENP
jgi:predicted nuclease of predicted toxin-antitoxin system